MFKGTAAPLEGLKRGRAARAARRRVAREGTARALFRPRVFQARDAVEHGCRTRVVDAIGDEVAVALELPALVTLTPGQRRLEPGAHLAEAVGVEGLPEVAVAGIGLWLAEQSIEQSHGGADRTAFGRRVGADPADRALDLDRVGARRAALGVGHHARQHRADAALRVFLAAGALDHHAVLQAHLVAREQAKESLGWHLGEIVTLDPH